MLSLGFGMEPTPALVMTVWPFAKKPRPVAQEVGIARVKCFRAVILTVSELEPGRLLPTDHVWRYLGCQVLAVLDVEEAQLENGFLKVSQRSMEAIEQLTMRESGHQTSGDMGPEHEKNKGKKAKTIKAPTFKAVRRRLRQCALASEKKKVSETGKTDETRRPWIFLIFWD